MRASKAHKVTAAIPSFGVTLGVTLALTISGCTLAPAAQGSAPEMGADLGGVAQWRESCGEWDEWDKPGPAYRIHGNSYYVGTCGISAILITGDQGHILIDGGTQAGGKMIAANIESLGFDLKDVKILLQSHEHFDHVAGLAFLQNVTGARLIASKPAAPVMASGIAAENDPQFGSLGPLPGARVDSTLPDSHQVSLGNLLLKAIATPGHTQGALSWQWTAQEGDHMQTIVYADSLSPVSSDSYRFSDHPDYVASYRDGLRRLASLDCDMLLTPHPSASGLLDKNHTSTNACKDYANGIGKRLDDRLAQETESQNT